MTACGREVAQSRHPIVRSDLLLFAFPFAFVTPRCVNSKALPDSSLVSRGLSHLSQDDLQELETYQKQQLQQLRDCSQRMSKAEKRAAKDQTESLVRARPELTSSQLS